MKWSTRQPNDYFLQLPMRGGMLDRLFHLKTNIGRRECATALHRDLHIGDANGCNRLNRVIRDQPRERSL